MLHYRINFGDDVLRTAAPPFPLAIAIIGVDVTEGTAAVATPTAGNINLTKRIGTGAAQGKGQAIDINNHLAAAGDDAGIGARSDSRLGDGREIFDQL